jgi:hypothetical protein
MSIVPRIRRAAIVETLVFLVTVVALNLAFGDATRYIGMPLHPFWIIVLLISVQYGPAEGLAAALLSTAFLLVGNLPEQSLAETMYEYILRVSFSPFLWIVTALVLGSIRARQLDERKGLLEQLWKSEEASAAIVESYKVVKQSKERLELRLAEERRSVLTMYEVAKSLETLDAAEAMAGIEQLVVVALNPKKFSLYRWKGNALCVDTSYGWTSDEEFTQKFHVNSNLVRQALRKSRVLSISREDDEALLDGQGMLAGPIVDEQTGELLGMLKIEETGFTDMGIRTRETFRIVCAWIARVYVNVDAHQDALSKIPETAKSAKTRRRSTKKGDQDSSESSAA